MMSPNPSVSSRSVRNTKPRAGVRRCTGGDGSNRRPRALAPVGPAAAAGHCGWPSLARGSSVCAEFLVRILVLVMALLLASAGAFWLADRGHAPPPVAARNEGAATNSDPAVPAAGSGGGEQFAPVPA